MNAVRTYSGREVLLNAPDPASIEIRDIACSLSRINRFSGATWLPVNVADHSLNVVRWLAMAKAPPIVQMHGLLHDAHEAYIGDITEPMRRELHAYATFDVVRRIADRLDVSIRLAFGLDRHTPRDCEEMVQKADRAVFAAEWRDLMKGPAPVCGTPAPFAIKPRNSDQAETSFITCFQRLQLEIGPPVCSSFN